MTAIRAEFDRTGLGASLTRFPAIDAKSPDFAAPGYAPATWRDRWALLPSEQAIFLSHRALWEKVAQGQGAGAIICEDDILISREFSTATGARDLDKYGVIKLDGFNAARRYGPIIRTGVCAVRDILGAVPSAACYALSRGAAQRLLDDSQQFCATLDDYLFAPRPGLRPVQIWPAVAVQGMCCHAPDRVPDSMSHSERSAPADPTRADKGPFLYRLRKEIGRAGLKTAQTLGGDRRLRARGGVLDCPDLAKDLPPYKV